MLVTPGYSSGWAGAGSSSSNSSREILCCRRDMGSNVFGNIAAVICVCLGLSCANTDGNEQRDVDHYGCTFCAG